MAVLRMVFGSYSGRKVNINFNYANTAASAVQVKTLMQIIVACGDVFTEPPLSLIGAEFFMPTTVPINIS